MKRRSQSSFNSEGKRNKPLNSGYCIEVDSNDNIYVVDSDNHNIQMFDRHGVWKQFYVVVNKGKVLEPLSNYLGIAPERILVFGDEENDIEMFKFTGYGICMPNGCLNLKAIAHKVSTFSNNEEGVLKEIEKLLQLENSLK